MSWYDPGPREWAMPVLMLVLALGLALFRFARWLIQ